MKIVWKGSVSVMLALVLLGVVAPVKTYASCDCFRTATRNYVQAMRKCTSSRIRNTSGARTICAIRRIIHAAGGAFIGGSVGGTIGGPVGAGFGGGLGGAIGSETGQARCESYIRKKVQECENSAYRTLSAENKRCKDQGLGCGRRNSHDREDSNHV